MKHHNIAVAVIRKGDEIALVLETAPERGRTDAYWTLPGGMAEEGEDHRAAVIREAAEETGLAVKGPGKLLYTCIYDNKRDHSICHVQAYLFEDFDGALSPRDPDGSVERAAFFSVPEALEKIKETGHPAVFEPAAFHLNNPGHAPRSWHYEDDGTGKYTQTARKPLSNTKKNGGPCWE